MYYYLAVWSLLLGLVIGSFLNVVIYRLPRGESLIRPGSHCPWCGYQIDWYDNVPVFSWVLLRARCRACRTHISGRYPAVEGLTGIMFLAAYVAIGLSPAVLVVWALIAVIVTLAFIHHDLGVVPNPLCLPAAGCFLAASIGLDPAHWWYYLAGSVGAGLLSLLMSLLYPGVVRFSEAKIALLMGAVFGPWVLAAIPTAVVLRSVARITLVFCQKGRLRALTAFVPYVSDADPRQDVEIVHKHQSKADTEVMTWL